MSDSLVLDTDVASYLFKNSPRAKPFRPLLKGKRPALAFVSVAELFKWTLKRHWGPRKIEQLETALRRYVPLRPRPGVGTGRGRLRRRKPPYRVI